MRTRVTAMLLLFVLVGCDDLGFETRASNVRVGDVRFQYETARVSLDADRYPAILKLGFFDGGSDTRVGDELDLELTIELERDAIVTDAEWTFDGAVDFAPRGFVYPQDLAEFTPRAAHDDMVVRAFLNATCEHVAPTENVFQRLGGRVRFGQVRDEFVEVDVTVYGEGIPFAEPYTSFEIDGAIDIRPDEDSSEE